MMVTACASTCCGLAEKSFSLILAGARPCIRLGMKGNRPTRRIQSLEGIVPASRHFWRCQPWLATPSRVLGVTARPTTVLISGRLRPEIKVVFILVLLYISMFAGAGAGL